MSNQPEQIRPLAPAPCSAAICGELIITGCAVARIANELGALSSQLVSVQRHLASVRERLMPPNAELSHGREH